MMFNSKLKKQIKQLSKRVDQLESKNVDLNKKLNIIASKLAKYKKGDVLEIVGEEPYVILYGDITDETSTEISVVNKVIAGNHGVEYVMESGVVVCESLVVGKCKCKKKGK